MIKDPSSDELGNTADTAPLSEWLSTIKTVDEKISTVRVIIPGHGDYGNKQLLDHTKKIIGKHIPVTNKVKVKKQ